MFGLGKCIKGYIKTRYYKRKKIYCEPFGTIGKDAVVESNVKIGKYSYIPSGHIYSNVTIGRYCSMAINVVIGAPSHPLNWLSTSPFQYEKDKTKYDDQKKTIIGNDVWIGANVCIKDGITVGDGAAIGAGAVVVKDVPPYAIVVGVPAKVLRYRFDENTIEELLELKWWEKDIDELKDLPLSNIKVCLQNLKDMKKTKENNEGYYL